MENQKRITNTILPWLHLIALCISMATILIKLGEIKRQQEIDHSDITNLKGVSAEFRAHKESDVRWEGEVDRRLGEHERALLSLADIRVSVGQTATGMQDLKEGMSSLKTELLHHEEATMRHFQQQKN